MQLINSIKLALWNVGRLQYQVSIIPYSRSRTFVSVTVNSGHCHQHQSNLLYQYVPVRNAGHAKWQNIMHTKSANDIKKSTIRAKCASQIKVAIREGGSADPKLNKKLADMIEIARNNQVPAENIQRVLAESKNAKDLKLFSYALKGPGQSVVIVECETDNFNRERQDLSSLVKKLPFVVTDAPSIMYQFQHVGIIYCSEFCNKPVTEDHLEAAVANALEAGASDVNLRVTDDEYGTVLEFTTDPSPNTFYPVITALKDLNYKITYSQLEYIPRNPVQLSDSQLESVSVAFEKLRNHPPVIRVFDNIA